MMDQTSLTIPINKLIVCRSPAEISLLDRVRREPDCCYLVGSDDIRVHREMEKYPWIQGVCWLEQMESFYGVAPEVIKFLEIINQWLASLGDNRHGIPPELLFWIRHCEGGMTTQRIQDLLLLIRSYQYLLDTCSISSIIILSHPQTEWEDQVLAKVGQSKGLKVEIIGCLRPSILKAKLVSWLKLLAREPYAIYSILRTRLRPGFQTREANDLKRPIAFQLCSSEDRHAENIIPLMKALKDKDQAVVAFRWQVAARGDVLQKESLPAADLEKWVSFTSLWEAPYRVFLTWKRARERREELLANPELSFRGVPVGPLLWPSVRYFFAAELSQRYRFLQAVKIYLAGQLPKAIKIWGGGILPEGHIVLKNLPKTPRPLIFNWFFGTVLDNPYESGLSSIDLFLAAGQAQKKYFERHGVPPERIALVGMSRYDHLYTFKKEFKKSYSLSFLNISDDFSYYILFDSNATLRGYLSAQEQLSVTEALLEFAGQHPEVALLVKPHPSHRSGTLEGLIDSFSLPNVFLIEKKMLPYHALNAADLLITKLSMIGLDAMLLSRPVLAVVLDGEEHFKIYGGAVENISSLATLKEILTMLVSEAGKKEAWVRDQMQRQKAFLEFFLGDPSSFSSAKMGAEALEEFLRNNN
jgi:hypothetical protein